MENTLGRKAKRKGNSPVGTKGYTGNPNGRPKKGTALTDLLNMKLDENKTRESVVVSLIELATTCPDPAVRFNATRYIFDRIDGRPVETVRNEDQEKLVNQLDKVLQAVKGELQS